MRFGARIAIYHDDSDVAAKIEALAAGDGVEFVYPSSETALEIELHDALTAAVVVDLAGPKGGGFELLERIANAPSHPLVIVITALDAKTSDSIRRLASTKGLKVRVFRKTGDEELLRVCLAELEKREVRFTAEHLSESIDKEYLSVEYQPK